MRSRTGVATESEPPIRFRIRAARALAGGPARARFLGGRRSGAGLVLSPPYLVGSVMLWIAYFMGLVIFYALINWMPILFREAGVNPRSATLVSALFPLATSPPVSSFAPSSFPISV